MNFNNKNNYIKLPTHEPERITQIFNQNFPKEQKEKIISEIKRALIIYNIIISLLITILVVAASVKLTSKKWKRNVNLKPKIYEQMLQRKIHQNYIISSLKGELLNKPSKINAVINPQISVIISVYNKEKYILRILRSIQNQNFENIEIIFADDCSKDKSVKLIEKYQIEDRRIKLIKHDKNVGTLINRNDAAMSAKGEYLLFIDCDDLLLNNILIQQKKIYNI